MLRVDFCSAIISANDRCLRDVPARPAPAAHAEVVPEGWRVGGGGFGEVTLVSPGPEVSHSGIRT